MKGPDRLLKGGVNAFQNKITYKWPGAGPYNGLVHLVLKISFWQSFLIC